jgi:phenylpropionate dioxygenase-like ring-hydroxylating dioxygenase large terminal subunit
MNYQERPTSRIPTEYYTSERAYQVDRRRIEQTAATYLGHQSLVPSVGDYRSLYWEDHGRALIHNARGYQVINNVCRHRQSTLLQGRGRVQNISCPLHGWTYDLEGQLLGAPCFEHQPEAELGADLAHSYQGLLFSGAEGDRLVRNLATLPVLQEYDFGGYHLGQSEVTDYDFDWKTFMEVYLELYHVGPYHPGLSSLVDLSQIEWQFGTDCNAQVIGYKSQGRNHLGNYTLYKQSLADQGIEPKHGAIWITCYPNIMLEIYPGALTVSAVFPTGPGRCMNLVEHYYPEDVLYFAPELVRAHQKCYAETAREDAEICARMQQGRRALANRGRSMSGPVLGHLEEGVYYFHRYLTNAHYC